MANNTSSGAALAEHANPPADYDVFISYKRDDPQDPKNLLPDALCDRLEKLDYTVFVDRSDLHGGDNYSERLERTARTAPVVVALLTTSYLESPWCMRELVWATGATSGEAAGSAPSNQRRVLPILNEELAVISALTSNKDIAVGQASWPARVAKQLKPPYDKDELLQNAYKAVSKREYMQQVDYRRNGMEAVEDAVRIITGWLPPKNAWVTAAKAKAHLVVDQLSSERVMVGIDVKYNQQMAADWLERLVDKVWDSFDGCFNVLGCKFDSANWLTKPDNLVYEAKATLHQAVDFVYMPLAEITFIIYVFSCSSGTKPALFFRAGHGGFINWRWHSAKQGQAWERYHHIGQGNTMGKGQISPSGSVVEFTAMEEA